MIGPISEKIERPKQQQRNWKDRQNITEVFKAKKEEEKLREEYFQRRGEKVGQNHPNV